MVQGAECHCNLLKVCLRSWQLAILQKKISLMKDGRSCGVASDCLQTLWSDSITAQLGKCLRQLLTYKRVSHSASSTVCHISAKTEMTNIVARTSSAEIPGWGLVSTI